MEESRIFERYFDGVKLNSQQQKAFEALRSFSKSNSERVFILRGYAGTGKTTLMKGYIKWLSKESQKFALLASTGRAAKILSDKTGCHASTVHSRIYSFSDLDSDLEALSEKEKEKEKEKDYEVDETGQIRLLFDLRSADEQEMMIYIIDEASMIGDRVSGTGSFADFGSGNLLQDLFDYDKNGKFVFVGDPCQLPPIGQKHSPALFKEYIQEQYGIKSSVADLTTIERQEQESGIVKASLLLRRLQHTNPPVKFAHFPLRGFNDITLYDNEISLINTYMETIKSKGMNHAAIITQTNRTCAAINKIIRQSLGRINRLEKGDLLLVTQNNNMVNLVNGDLVKVVQVGEKENRCRLTFRSVTVMELASRRTVSLYLIEDILDSLTTNLNERQHKALLMDYYYRMRDLGITQDSEDFKMGLLEDPYLNALKSVYGYALTCHKGQGGEWNEVFLYMDNKIHGIPKPSIYQWVYTAITRAKERLHVVDDWFISSGG